MYPIIKPDYRHGYYQVGNENYINKTHALIAATQSKQSVHWNFHDQIYKSIDWTKRPPGSLKDLYRLRAQQIRDRYDYVIVHFSGGSDSWTVLNSFLSNNIHVDEVYTRWARAERQYRSATNLDHRECNLGSEYEYATEPVLKEIEQRFPSTYIYVDDYSESYQQDISEHMLDRGGHYTAMGTFHRFSRKSPGEINALSKGKRIGVVYGFDKIQCQVVNGQFNAYFVDRVGISDIDPERNVEGFYWTQDMPEIAIMQAHDLKSYYQTQLNKIQSNSVDLRTSYIKTCYPDYDLQTFQVGKAAGSKIWASELWIQKYNPRYVESWEWALSQFSSNIDDRYYNYFSKLRLGYKVIRSQSYHVGQLISAEPINYDFAH